MHRASGDECYVCYDTRRRFFDNTQKDRLEIRKAQPTVEARRQRVRNAKASGDPSVKSEERISVARNYVEQSETTFNEAFERGCISQA